MKWQNVVLSICLFNSMGDLQSFAQAQKKADFRSIREVRSSLMSGTDSDRLQVSAQLRLKIPKWTRIGATRDIPCTLFDSVRSYDAKLSATVQGVLLDIYSSACQYTFLTALEHLPNGQWRYIDTVPFWSQDHEPKVSVESLVEEGTKEIIVDGFLADNGTGIYQTDYAVVKLLQGKLSVVLDEPLHVTYDVAGPQGSEQSQDSTFKIVHVENDHTPNTSFRRILEEQVLKSGNYSMTRRWIYLWIPEIQRFEAVMYTGRQK